MKNIQGIDGYSIRKDGAVFSHKSDRFLKTFIANSGYVRVGLYLGKGKVKQAFVHRLIAQAYIENPKNKIDVNHLNGDKADNRIENLEWATRSENVKHAFDTGLNKVSEKAKKLSSERAKKYVGRNSPQAMSVSSFNEKNELVKTYTTITEAAKDIGCLNSSLSNCLAGKTKTCSGLKWKYNDKKRRCWS